jgi:type III pantothenate kinase
VPDDRPRREERDADPDRQPARGRRRSPGQRDRNIDAVSADGAYLGGAIGPGLEIALTALIDRAAGISRLNLGEPQTAIGRSTRAAINSGFIFGFAGMIDGIVKRMETELPEPRLLATGGLASAIVPFSETIDEVDDLLTLKGLRLIHERNAS